MSNEENILITGATGNLGSQILKLILLDNKKSKIILLIRAENKIQARKRVIGLLKWLFRDKYKDYLTSNITVLLGDISNNKFGLSDRDYRSLVQKIDIIYHSAALTQFNAPISKLRLVNIVGTQRVLDIVSESKKSVILHYISTAFIAGNFNGKFKERDCNINQAFNNPYEESKFEAEENVRELWKSKKQIYVYRPSIVVGEYKTGAISDFQMFYKPLYLLSKEVFERIPVNRSTLLNLIPVDIAAQMIFTLAKNPFEKNVVYHIVSPKSFNIIKVIDFASKYFNFDKPKLSQTIKFKNSAIACLYAKQIQPFINYFTFRAEFESRETIDRLKKLNFYFPKLDNDFLKRIFIYAVKMKYIRINNR